MQVPYIPVPQEFRDEAALFENKINLNLELVNIINNAPENYRTILTVVFLAEVCERPDLLDKLKASRRTVGRARLYLEKELAKLSTQAHGV